MKPILLALAILATAAIPVAAKVKITVLPDGTPFIYNESPRQHAARVATDMVPVPQARIEELIDRNARVNGLDPKLVKAVVQVESGYNQKALSSKGAMGLMQLMPATADLMGVSDPYDPVQNLRGGTAYLRQLLRRFSGKLELALAGYNAGPDVVERYGGMPPFDQTTTYVARVLHLYRGDPLPPRSRRRTARKGRKTYVVTTPDHQILITTDPTATH